MNPVRRSITRELTSRRILQGRTHGRPSTYNDGCRCDPCTDANAVKTRQWRQQRAA